MPAASAGASVWHRKGREGDGIVQRDEGRRGVRLRRLRTGDPGAQVLRGQRRGCLLLLGAALLLRRAACAQEVGSRLRPRKARTRANEVTKSTRLPSLQFQPRHADPPDGPLQSFCNPNARSPMGFVGTPWETGPWFSLQMATVLEAFSSPVA